MMKRIFFLALFMPVLALAPLAAQAAGLAPGDEAPVFSTTDIDGNSVDLDTLKGKTVVLEWTNHECPYVKKHYETGNMQKTQTIATSDEDIVWVTLISSAPGKQGYVDEATAKQLTTQRGAQPTHVVLDPSGEIGKAYDAKTTPHMFVIDPEGKLAYMGAIDDQPTARGDTEGANNFVLAALVNMREGKAPNPPQTRPYGCGVKY